MIVYYCCLILVQLQSNVYFQMTVEDFPCRGQPNLHTNFLTVTFRAEHLSLIVLPRFRLQCNNFTCPVIHRTLRLPCKVNHAIPGIGQVDFSLDLLISLKVPKSNRSEDPFFPVLLPALCVEMLATPTLRLFSVCT